MVSLTAPYVSGFLAFREVPFLVDAVRRLREKEPCLMPQAGTPTRGGKASAGHRHPSLVNFLEKMSFCLEERDRLSKKLEPGSGGPTPPPAPGHSGLLGEGQFS